jgi:hypothetical protein
MTVKKIAVATKSFKPLIQKPDKKRKATDDNEDDDLINIIKSTNHKKPKQAKKKGMTEESCETITENEVPSAAAVETEECDGNNRGDDGTKKAKAERKNLVSKLE